MININTIIETLVPNYKHININKNINRKKLINIIKHNIINNEVILLISGIFECNIWIYYEENNIFKVYYLEENFNKNKKNVIISFGKIINSIEYGYQMCYIDDIKLFDYNHQIIQNFLSNYLIIPIGLEENKKLIYNNNDSNPLFENVDQIMINENQIFKSLNLVKE
jgi:hypothetical protein